MMQGVVFRVQDECPNKEIYTKICRKSERILKKRKKKYYLLLKTVFRVQSGNIEYLKNEDTSILAL